MQTGSQQLGARKIYFPAIWKLEKLVPSYFEPEKHCRSYLEREKSGSLLFGDQKISTACSRTPWPSSTATCCSTPVSSKKRKHSKIDAFELALGNVVEKLTEAQSESELS